MLQADNAWLLSRHPSAVGTTYDIALGTMGASADVKRDKAAASGSAKQEASGAHHE